MEASKHGAPPEPAAGRGRRARVQATDAHTTLRPAARMVVVVVLVPRLLTEQVDNGKGSTPSTGAPGRHPLSDGGEAARSSAPGGPVRDFPVSRSSRTRRFH